MSINIRTVYINGSYTPYNEASVHIDDRGYQFGDGVYEVIAANNGKLVDGEEHLIRLEKSLHNLDIDMPLDIKTFLIVIRRILELNYVSRGLIYIQVSRGVLPRQHLASDDLCPSVVVYAKSLDYIHNIAHSKGVSVETMNDHRWFYHNIKATGPLLANCMAKKAATKHSFDDAWLINEDGFITEGTASNAWMVRKDGVVMTYPENHNILSGVVRSRILSFLDDLNIPYEVAPFTLSSLKDASEAFSSASISLVTPVVKVNDIILSGGKIGPVTQKIQKAYLDYIHTSTV